MEDVEFLSVVAVQVDNKLDLMRIDHAVGFGVSISSILKQRHRTLADDCGGVMHRTVSWMWPLNLC